MENVYENSPLNFGPHTVFFFKFVSALVLAEDCPKCSSCSVSFHQFYSWYIILATLWGLIHSFGCSFHAVCSHCSADTSLDLMNPVI